VGERQDGAVLGAKVYRVRFLSPAKHIQISLQLRTVISCDQYYLNPAFWKL